MVLQDSLDAYVIAAGPSAAASYRAHVWDSELGVDLYVVRRSDGDWAVIGGSLGITTQGLSDKVRLTADFVVARTILGRPVGLGIGPTVDLFPTHRPWRGGHATLWFFFGMTPYIRTTVVHGLGASTVPELELGVKIPLEIMRW